MGKETFERTVDDLIDSIKSSKLSIKVLFDLFVTRYEAMVMLTNAELNQMLTCLNKLILQMPFAVLIKLATA